MNITAATIEVDREKLLVSLSILKECLIDQKLFPALSHFYFNQSSISAFNGVQGIEVHFDLDINCIVPGDELTKLVSSYSCKKLNFKQTDKSLFFTTDDSSQGQVELMTLPLGIADVFSKPDLSNLEELHSFDLTPDFILGLERCLISVNQNPLLPSQFGVCMYYDKEGGITLYSTTGKSVSRYIVQELDASGDKEPNKLILPEAFCELILQVSINHSGGSIFIANDFVLVVFDEVLIFSKIDVGVQFLDFESVVNSNYPKGSKLHSVPDGLEESVKRSLLFISSEVDKIVDMKINRRQVSLVTTKSRGCIKDKITFKEDLGEGNFKMNADLFMNGITFVDQVSFLESPQGWIFVGEKDNFLHMVSSL